MNREWITYTYTSTCLRSPTARYQSGNCPHWTVPKVLGDGETAGLGHLGFSWNLLSTLRLYWSTNRAFSPFASLVVISLSTPSQILSTKGGSYLRSQPQITPEHVDKDSECWSWEGTAEVLSVVGKCTPMYIPLHSRAFRIRRWRKKIRISKRAGFFCLMSPNGARYFKTFRTRQEKITLEENFNLIARHGSARRTVGWNSNECEHLGALIRVL